MHKYFPIILFILSLTSLAEAQSNRAPHPPGLFDERDFFCYTVIQGLNDNNITCLQQDANGYIWIGTDQGVNRFDGHSFRNLSRIQSTPPLVSRKISRFKLFGPNRLGIIGHDGFQLLNTSDLALQDFSIADTTVFNTYRNMGWDASPMAGGSVALTTASGFYQFDTSGALLFRYDKYRLEDIGNKKILFGRDIVRLNEQEYLVYIEDNKLAIFNPAEKKFWEIDTADKKWQEFYRPSTSANDLLGPKYQLNEHEFIFINNQKNEIVFYDHRLKRTVISPLPFHSTQELDWDSKITLLDSGRFTLTCSNYGFYLFHFDPQTGIITCSPEKFLPTREINCIFFDKERRLWVGTANGLLQQRLKPPFLHSFPLTTARNSDYAEFISSAYRYQDKLYVGYYSRSSGLTILNATTMKTERKIHFYGKDNMWNEVISLQMYHRDTLWLGTNGGVLWFDTKTEHYGDAMTAWANVPAGVREKIRYKPRVARMVNLTPSGKDGYAWLTYGLQGVVSRYGIASRTMTFFTDATTPALPFNKVKKVLYDAFGNVWVSGHALARWNSHTLSFDTLINIYGGSKKFNPNILVISADDSGSLWLHNEENGLLEYNIRNKKFIPYGPSEGLPSQVYESFSPVLDNILWMASGTTLTGFDTRTKKAVVYDYSDGLSSYKPTSRKIYYDTAGKYFYLCCGNDLVRFPSRLPSDSSYSSDILIEQLVINNSRLLSNPIDGIRLSPDSNDLSIHFTIVDFEAGNGYTFSYKLSKTENWTSLGQDRNLNLNSLAPGNYSILLRAAGKSGMAKFKEFNFVILPHFWQTAWFILLMTIAFITTLYFLYRNRVSHIRQKANIDKQLAQMEMKALHAQMNPHFIFNCLNSIKEMVLNDENSEASNYLSRFAQMIRITLDQSVHTSVTLRSTVDYLSRYIEMEKIRNEHFSCLITVDKKLDQDEIVLPPMLIQPFIENAIWHGILPSRRDIRIQVHFRYTNDRLVCIVEDDGIGIEKSIAAKKGKDASRQSFGITNVRERIHLLNEKYNWQSQIHIVDKSRSDQGATGTVVTLELQLQTLNE